MPCFSKPLVALALLSAALAVPVPTGTLDEVPWTPCGTMGDPMWCGDLYFCGAPWGNITVSPQPPTATSGWAYAYKASPTAPCIPGASPIIRVQPGQGYKLMFHNTLPMDPAFVDPNSALGLNMTTAWDPTQDPTMNSTGFAYWGQMNLPLHTTNLHLHGAHISGMGDHDNVLRPVLPGQCQAYIYRVNADNPGGMHIYHPHAHGRVAYQFLGGAFGPFIISDYDVNMKTNGIGKDTNKGKDVDQPVKNFLTFSNLERVLNSYSEFGTRMGNGVSGNLFTGAQMSMTANQWFRWRILHAKAEGTLGWTAFVDTAGVLLTPTSGPQCEVYELAQDGVYLSIVPYKPKGSPQYSFNIHGASRLEVAIRCALPGTFVINYEGGPTATVTVAPTPVPNPYPDDIASPFSAGGVSQWRPNRPRWLSDLRQGMPGFPPEAKTVVRQVIKINFAGINGVLFDQATGPVFAAQFDPSIIYELEFHNTAIHPTHVHLEHMQVVTPGGCGGMKEGEFYDTATTAGPGICTVRTRYVDFSGLVIIHCHVLDHEDMGILGYISVPFKAPGSFEAGPKYSSNTKPGICCTPQTDGTGALVCRGVPQCGATVGVDTCNRPCSVPTNVCPASKPYCSTTGECFATAKSFNGEPVADGASEGCTTPYYPFIIMGVGLAVAVAAVVSAVCVIRSRSATYGTILIEEMKQDSLHLPTRNLSPFPGTEGN